MSSSLIELFERVPSGVLWVQVDGSVRHVNSEARRVSALRPGDMLRDPALLMAVQLVARVGIPRLSSLSNSGRLLRCRVMPGLGKDDSFVLLEGGGAVDETLGGADRLLRAVDQGLRAPLNRAASALQLWRDDSDPHGATMLVEQIDDLLVGLNRLLDLAGLWTTDGTGDDERIELWPLLQQAWAEVEPLGMARGVGLQFRSAGDAASQATLYGNRRWLRRAFAECLRSALSVVPAGEQIEIEHLQAGARARIVFRNRVLFADAASGGLGAIALMMCRQVLALHGGTLVPEGADSEWVLELPTGAPALVSTQDTTFGMAQAQIYARDLAELMQRSRSTPNA